MELESQRSFGVPTPADEAARLEDLAGLEILDTPREAAFDDLVNLAAAIFGVPVAAISLLDASRQWFKATVGIPVNHTPRSQAVCAYTIVGQGPFLVGDLQSDSRFCQLPLVEEGGLKFYAGVPIASRHGHAIGTLCVAAPFEVEPTPQQIEALERLGRQAAALLELHRTRLALRRQAKMMDAVSDRRERFLSELGREVRTSMTGIIGLAEVMAASTTSVREREYAATIAKSGRAVMNAFGEAVEPRSKSQSLLSEAISNCFVILRPAALARNVRLTYEISASLDLATEVDPREFRAQLARRVEVLYGGHGATFVHCQFTEDRNHVHVELRSDGRLIGSSLGSEWTVSPQGTICRFSIARLESASPLRVLVVEDNDVNNLILTSMLSDMGCKVTSVSSAQGALDRLAQEPFSLVLTDIQMPEMDGLTMTKAIRAREGDRHIPVIAVTASTVADELSHYRECGIDDTIQKPFSERDIADVIARWRYLA